MTYTIQLTCKGSQELHIYVGRIIGVFTLWYQQALLMETRQIYWQYEQIVHAWTVRHLKCTLVKNIIFLNYTGWYTSVLCIYTKVIMVQDKLICQTLSCSYSLKHSSNWSGVNPLARIRCRASSNLTRLICSAQMQPPNYSQPFA